MQIIVKDLYINQDMLSINKTKDSYFYMALKMQKLLKLP